MRIAYIYTALTTFGGVDRVLTEKANYLADSLGYEVYIITDSQNGRPLVFPLSENVKHIDLNTDFDTQYKYGLFKRYFYYRRMMKRFKRELEDTLLRIKPDITITTCGRDLDFLNSLKDRSVKMGESHTTKNYMRNLYLMKQKGFPYKQVASHWEKKMVREIKKLHTFVVLNEHDAKSWKDIRDVRVIPNSLPFKTSKVSTLRNHRIISVGRLSIEKGADRMIEIWKKVAMKHPDWALEWYGHGPLQEEIRQIVKDEHLENSFHINEPTSNIVEKYLNSDIYTLCSRFEGFGMVLIEAMSCGLPCISFDCPHGPRTIIQNEKNGLLITDNDINSYVSQLERLMNDVELRERMGKAAKESTKKYAVEKIMKQWDELFHEIKR